MRRRAFIGLVAAAAWACAGWCHIVTMGVIIGLTMTDAESEPGF